MADLQQLGEDAAKLAAATMWPLSDDQITDLVKAAHRLKHAAAVLQARLVHQATTRKLPAMQGYRSTAGWLRSLLLLDPRPARQITEQAAVLGREPGVEQAVLDGRIDLRQAAVVAATVQAVPADLAGLGIADAADVADISRRAEHAMIEMAGRLPAHQLRRVGERILARVAPQVADRVEEAVLARHEARARRRRGVTLSLPVGGLVRLSGALGAEGAATVQAALHPLCQPTPDDERSAAQRRADALVEVCQLALRTGQLPEDGGESPQVAVTVANDPLTCALSAGTTDAGQRGVGRHRAAAGAQRANRGPDSFRPEAAPRRACRRAASSSSANPPLAVQES